MDFLTAVRTCFAKYATFSGRARRAELWWFALFNFIANIVLSILDVTFFGMGFANGMHGSFDPLSSIYGLIVILPSLAVGARRLHDIGRSGWWQLLVLIPIVGVIVLIWWFATKGESGPNDYGPDPLGGIGGDDGYIASSVPRVPRQ